MKTFAVSLLMVLLVVARVPYRMAVPSTVPAFLWSPHLTQMKEAVNYQTLSPKDLAKSVVSEGGWSNLLCRGEKNQQPVDLALVFVGRELSSSDISGSKHADPALIDLLKVSFTRSNFSVAFPYVAVSEEKEAIENSLISGFRDTCGHDLGVNNVAFLESCSSEGGNFKKLADLHSVHDYLVSRMETRPVGPADLVMFCHGGSHSEELDQSRPESEVFSELISSLELSGIKYTVLYVSDPYRAIRYPSYRDLERFLAEGTYGNGSFNSATCDEVCQIKSSLLEGLFVAYYHFVDIYSLMKGIVLLIILISGLCCMMGIDTPTRFEAPQDS